MSNIFIIFLRTQDIAVFFLSTATYCGFGTGLGYLWWRFWGRNVLKRLRNLSDGP